MSKKVFDEYETEEGHLTQEAAQALKDMMKTQGWQIFFNYAQEMMRGKQEELTEPSYRAGDNLQPYRSANDGMVLKEFYTGELHGMARIMSWPTAAVTARDEEKSNDDTE